MSALLEFLSRAQSRAERTLPEGRGAHTIAAHTIALLR